ncbi:hypothetical protein [Teredinibacter sp. KSP-S5-2]|uniref:hypothetical protein n=1 Tax=Teredinibacter sp. KSP-S5-2 TaxID=3034506 RepID=UPI002934C9EE|nr:hypothetical protein [Teredinibacter sp. KSP-S5-2]WNO09483.1 hypothetical protein P5V12_21315 [Teredinibacter sp. KSP-S5-2]
MKQLALVALLLTGCSCISHSGSSPTPPSGEAVFASLLANMSYSLKDEPLCQVTSASQPDMALTLGQHLATAFSLSYQSTNSLSVSSQCNLSKYETKNGQVKDMWDCSLNLVEHTPAKEFVSNSNIAFGLDLKTLSLIPNTIRCL